MHIFHFQLMLDAKTVLFDRNANKRETVILREASISSDQLSSIGSELAAAFDNQPDVTPIAPPAGMRPVPAPRRSVKRPPNQALETPLITLDSATKSSNRDLDLSGTASLQGGRPKNDSILFDPLHFSTERISGSNSSSESSISVIYTSSSSQESLGLGTDNAPQPKAGGASVKRKGAFYNQKRPQSFRGGARTSPTPQATEAQTIHQARKAFIQNDVTKPIIQKPSSELDQFDPLLTGQLAVDETPAQSSSPDNKLSDPEDNLLKDWNLDFNKRKTAPSVPPKPSPQSRMSVGSMPGMTSPSSVGGHTNLFNTGYVATGPTMGFPQQGFTSSQPMGGMHSASPFGGYPRMAGPVSNSPFLQHQLIARPSTPPRQRSPSPSAQMFGPRSSSGLSRNFSSPSLGAATNSQTQDPFGDLLNLTDSPAKPANPGSSGLSQPPQLLQSPINQTSCPAPKGSPTSLLPPSGTTSQSRQIWETFD